MERIDAHQHFWIYDPVRDSWISEDMSKIRRDFLPGDLAPLLKENKIDGCIAVQADQSLNETDFLLSLAVKNNFIKGVVGWVDIKSNDLDQTLALYVNQPLLKGFRHILQGEEDIQTFLKDGLFENGVAHILDKGYTYDLLVYHNQLDGLLPMINRLSEKGGGRLVLDHMGKPDLRSGDILNWKRNISLLAANKNVYCKVSGLVTEADWLHWKPKELKAVLDTVVEAFGPERLLFGSDWPVCLLATSYAKWLETLAVYFEGFSESQKEDIFGGNAIRFYDINI